MATAAYVGHPFELELALTDRATDQFPLVRVYRDGVLTTMVSLVHIDAGLYRATFTPSSRGEYAAHYFVYSDITHTALGLYDTVSESFEVNEISPEQVFDRLSSKSSCCIAPVSSPTACEPCEGLFDLSRAAMHERNLFDIFSREQSAIIAGGEADLYLRDKGRSRKDPLYGEPTRSVWVGPYRLKVYLQNPVPSPMTTPQGYRNEWNGEVWIPRTEIELRSIRGPDNGDVIQMWKIPFYDALSVEQTSVPRAGFYFDVERVHSDGIAAMAPIFVGFKLTLKRRSEFTAERRVLPPPAGSSS